MRKALACVAVILGFSGIAVGLSSVAGASTGYYEYSSVQSDVSIGTSVTDTFTVYLSENYTQPQVQGTITYNVYGPSSSTTCAATGSPIGSWTTDMNGNAQVPPASGSFNALTTGNYFWTITYSGDSALGVPAAYSCNIEDVQGYTYAYNNLSGAGGENLPLSVTLGTAVTDSATVSSYDNSHPLTGTVEYIRYPNANCGDGYSPGEFQVTTSLRGNNHDSGCYPVCTCIHRSRYGRLLMGSLL